MMTIWLLAAYLSLLPCMSWAAETIPPKSFSNVDQVVGWVKAKGKCREDDGRVVTCGVSVVLPRKDNNGKELSPGWLMTGEIVTNEFTKEKVSRLILRIFRTRTVQVSPKDSASKLLVQRESQYETGTNGKLTKAVSKVEIMNYNLERLFKIVIRLPAPYLFEGMLEDEDVSENMTLLKIGFGLDNWIWESK